MTLIVRRAVLDDLEAALALLNDPQSIHSQTVCRHGAQPEDPAELYDRLAEDDNLVLCEGKRVVAYASWQYFGRHAHLNVMAVAGTRQRSGLGSRLFASFVAAVSHHEVSGYSLRAYADSPWALSFYERHGMRRINGRTDWEAATEGLRRFIKMEASEGRWPSTEKVLYFRELTT